MGLSIERSGFRKTAKFAAFPAALVYIASTIACGGEVDLTGGMVNCDGEPKKLSRSEILLPDRKHNVGGIPILTDSGRIAVPLDSIQASDVQISSRSSFRVFQKGQEINVTIEGNRISIDRPDRNIVAVGNPVPQARNGETELMINVECDINNSSGK